MKLSNIEKLFKKQINLEDFLAEILTEVNQYEQLLKKTGSSVPVFVDEDVSIDFTKKDFDWLLSLFNDNKLKKVEISYIADALLLSQNITFEDESLSDRLEEIVEG